MSLIIPDWVAHISTDNDDKDKKKPTCIFSIHVHPDGSRLATGGIDQKVRIWATEPILDPDVESMQGAHRLLTTLSRHTGSVVSVRFSPSGRYLASGSDDTVCLIWEFDPHGASGGSFGSFGSNEQNVESWRIHRRLTGHESDVVDIAWSADSDDSFLATVGLDSVVNVWSGPGQNGRPGFERVRRIAGHDGFVKGVVWDPKGQYLATQSDDKTLKIWRTSDWSCAKVITEPFTHSPSSNFFGRPSWSPDGAHIVAANAMNGPVFVANIIERGSWNSDVKLVGHEDSVVVAAFSPRLFRGLEGPESLATVLALGSRDQSISVWITGLSRPLIVLKDVFERQVTDLSWSQDGLTLYASSTAGTVAALVLSAKDVAEPLPLSASSAVKPKLFGLQSGLVNGTASAVNGSTGTVNRPNVLQPRKAGAAPQRASLVSVAPSAPPRATPASSSGIPKPVNARAGAERLSQQIDILPGGKRRIKPTLVGAQEPSYEAPPVLEPPQVASTSAMQMEVDQPSFAPAATTDNATLAASNLSQLSSSFANQQQQQAMMIQQQQQILLAQQQQMMQFSIPTTFQPDDAFEAALAAARLPKGRTRDGRILGIDLPREQIGSGTELQAPIDGDFFTKGLERALAVPAVMDTLKREGEGGGVVEVRNYDGTRPVEVTVLDAEGSAAKPIWMDFFSGYITRCAFSLSYLALAQVDGPILIYTTKGRRVGSIALESPVCLLECRGSVLMAMTTAGFLHRWNLKEDKELHRPISCLSLLKSADDIHNVFLHINGAPILILKNEQAWTIDTKKNSWTMIASGWYADCSPLWESRGRGRGTSGAGVTASTGDFTLTTASGRWLEPVRAIESEINSLVVDRNVSEVEPASKPPSDDTKRTKDFELAATLRHLEMRIQASILLGSREEFQSFLKAYAKKIADEGLKGLGEELVREYLGPIYYHPGSAPTWEPEVFDLSKRSLCKELLGIMAKGKALGGMVSTYQDLLKSMN